MLAATRGKSLMEWKGVGAIFFAWFLYGAVESVETFSRFQYSHCTRLCGVHHLYIESCKADYTTSQFQRISDCQETCLAVHEKNHLLCAFTLLTAHSVCQSRQEFLIDKF